MSAAPRRAARRKSSTRRPVGPGALLLLSWLAIALAHAVVLAMHLAHSPKMPWEQLRPFACFSIVVPVVGLWLRLAGYRGDNRLAPIALFLVGTGLTLQFRMGVFAASGGRGMLLALPLGAAALLLTLTLARNGRYRRLAQFGGLSYLAALAALAALLLFGRRFRGGLYLPGNINPSEIVKPLLIAFLAAFLSNRKADFSATQIGLPMPPARTLWRFALLWSVPLAMMLVLRDLGLIVLLNAMLVVMLYALGRKLGYLIIGGTGVLLLAVTAGRFSAHARARFEIWRDPFVDVTGKGWQILQSLTAMYAGGLWGAGIGAGTPQAVPIVASDFVYAAAAEELGLIACALLLLAYGALFLRGWDIAARVRGPFDILLAIGITASLSLQTLLNLAGVTKALPMTGIPLPFISLGGSSLAVSLAMVGLLMAISEGSGKKSKRR